MAEQIWLWIGFNVFVLAMLALDLGVFHRKAHVVSFKESITWTVVWVVLALLFNVGVWRFYGSQKALEFFTGAILQMSSVTHTVTMIGSRGDSNGVFTPPEIPVNPGAGKVAISTPCWHAVELLADGRGLLVPFRDTKAIAREVIGWLRVAGDADSIVFRPILDLCAGQRPGITTHRIEWNDLDRLWVARGKLRTGRRQGASLSRRLVPDLRRQGFQPLELQGPSFRSDSDDSFSTNVSHQERSAEFPPGHSRLGL